MPSLLQKFLTWVERSARSLRGGQQKDAGSRVMSRLMGGGAGYGFPGGWSQDRIEQVLHYKHWSYIAVRAKCQRVAGLTPNVAIVRDANDKVAGRDRSQRSTILLADKQLRDYRYVKSLKAIKPHEEIVPVRHNHPLCRLLSNPNEPDVAWDLWYELVMFLELTGNAYLWVIPNKLSLPRELWVIPSHWVYPRIGRNRLIDDYEIRPWIGPGILRFPPEEVIHFRFKSPIHKIDGYSAQSAGSEWIDAGESVDRARFFQFKNGCATSGAVELGENYEDPSDVELERLYAKFFARAQGEMNTGRPIIMPPGAKYTPLMFTPTEMAYIQSAEQIRDFVLALFGVPKEIAGIQDAGSEIAMYGPMAQFCQNAINPLLQYLGQVVTEKLAWRWDEHLRVWWDDPTPANPTQVNADIAADAAVGAISPNEVRALRGREPWRHGGDDPLVPMGLSPLPLNTGEDYGNLEIPAVSAERWDEETEGRSPKPPPKRAKADQPRKIQSSDVKPPLDVPDVRQSENYDCGAAALRAVCQFYGVGPESEEEYIAILDTDPKTGTRAAKIVEVAQDLGLSAEEISGIEPLARAILAGSPVICAIQKGGTPDSQDAAKEGHYVVALQITAKAATVQDPVEGRVKIPAKEWMRRWHDQDADGREYQQYGIVLAKAAKRARGNGRGKREAAWW